MASSKQSSKRVKRTSHMRENLMLLLLFVGVFAFIGFFSLLAIALARGERLTNDGIVPTGGVRIIAEPTLETIKINGKSYTLDRGLVNGLQAGVYTFEFEKEDFVTATRTVAVKTGLVTDIAVRLIPTSQALVQTNGTAITCNYFSPSGEFVYFTDAEGLWRQKTADSSPLTIFTPLLTKLLSATQITDLALDPSTCNLQANTNNSRLIWQQGAVNYILRADNLNVTSEVQKLSTLVTFPVSNASWSYHSDRILISSESNLFEYDLARNTSNLIMFSASKEFNYTLQSDEIIFIKENAIYTYKDASSTLLELPALDAASTVAISETALPIRVYSNLRDNKALVVVYQNNTSNTFVWYDLEQKSSLLIGNKPSTEIVSMNVDGRGLIVKESEGILNVLNIEEEKSSRTFTLNTQILLTNTLDVTTFNSTGSTIIVSRDQSFELRDRFGGNPVTISTSPYTFNKISGIFGNYSDSKIFLVLKPADKTTTLLFEINLR